jgi:transcriptional regulator with XRE-family HTH domain
MKQKPAISEADIGKRIKSLRNKKRITLESLAAETGFSKGYLSKVEKSEKAPPVSTLGTIARALGVTISMLLGEESPASPISLVKKEERPLITRDGTRFDYSYEAVAHKFADKMMEPFILTLPVNPKKRTLYQHEGQEILFVLEGTMKFLHGAEELIVEEGDCVYFDSGIPHFGESMGNKAVKCFMVIYNPSNR